MKKLSPEELAELSPKEAFEIVQTFGNDLQKDLSVPDFYNRLTYDKETVLYALLMIIRLQNEESDLISALCDNVYILFSMFIPTPREYEKQLRNKKLHDAVMDFDDPHANSPSSNQSK